MSARYGDISEDRVVRPDTIAQQIAELKTEINQLKQNPVPIGFVYVQLSGQSDPKTLWPNTEWKSVTENYAGLFFRAEGAGSSNFGDIQEAQGQSLMYKVDYADNKEVPTGAEVVVGDEYNSKYSWSGTSAKTCGQHMGESYCSPEFGINMKQGNQEIRPRNSAVRIWQRVQ